MRRVGERERVLGSVVPPRRLAGSSRQEAVVSVSAWPRVGVVSAAREGESLKERATRDAVMGGRGECENGESVEVVRVRV